MRWLLSWILFGMGDLVSRPMLRWGWPVYCIYNRLMIWASNIQGDGPGPWEKIKTKNENTCRRTDRSTHTK